jgi:hypothetical protein
VHSWHTRLWCVLVCAALMAPLATLQPCWACLSQQWQVHVWCHGQLHLGHGIRTLALAFLVARVPSAHVVKVMQPCAWLPIAQQVNRGTALHVSAGQSAIVSHTATVCLGIAMLMHSEQLCINFLLCAVCSCASSHPPMRRQS